MRNINAVSAIIFNDNKILVIQSNDTEVLEFPKFTIKIGENPESALRNGIKEKFSTTIMTTEWIGTVDNNSSSAVTKIYICTIKSGEISSSYYTKWVKFSEINNITLTEEDKNIISNFGLKLELRLRYISEKVERKGDYYAYVFESTKTMNLLDEFEGININSAGPYKRFILRNIHEATIGKYLCKYHLIVERFSDIRHAEGNITFSEFKKEKGIRVYGYCDYQLRQALKKNGKILNKKEFYFDRPYYLRAQNSRNREGYGWEWDWSYGFGMSTEGTLYGETDDYAFVGVVFESVVKKIPIDNEKDIPTDLLVELTMHKGKKYYKIHKSEDESFLIAYKKGMSKQDALKLYSKYC